MAGYESSVQALTVSSTNPNNPSTPFLPPCRICGEKASGFHYGVNTCEACKGFFRRSLQRLEDYTCLKNGNCMIRPGRRNYCASCRFKKCLSVGMSKSAIKTGRYTHAKKARDITEVKRLQKTAKESNIQVGDLAIDMAIKMASIDVKQEVCNTKEHYSQLVDTTSLILNDSNYAVIDLINRLTNAYLSQSFITQEFLDKMGEKETLFMEQKALQEKMFGPLKPIPSEEYRRIWKTTGIDIDGRREMVKDVMPQIERSIKKFITFSKSVPGFKELPMEDQITLVKASRFDCWLMTIHKTINAEKLLYTNMNGITFHKDDLIKLDDGPFIEEFFRLGAMLKRLSINDSEIALMQGLSIMSRDRCILKAPHEVEQCQNRILDAMIYYVQSRYQNSQTRLGWLLHALTELRMVDINRSRLEMRINEWKDMEFPPLVLEMWSS